MRADSPGLWIDPRFSAHQNLPLCKVHLDFHNSRHIPEIGGRFDAEAWGDTLVAAQIDGIVVFAKDMHGFFYYPSRHGPVHPGLSFDLLGQQIKACRERNIAVYAYYCTAWDHHLAETRPEWNMIKRDGTDYRPKPGELPEWTALCLGNSDFVDRMADHIEELASTYEIDGVWLDMAEPIAPECYCPECLKQIRESGKDPDDPAAQRELQNLHFLNFHRRMRTLVKTTRPGCQIDFNDIGIGRMSERADLLDSVDVEALPTDPQWGYFYAPAQLRYQRNFGVPVYGMTGRFIASWADFGGLKRPEQLDVELASLVANAIRCDVGDQMPPDGMLDAAVYSVLGRSFGRIQTLRPWLEQAAPVTEAALLIPSVAMERITQPYLFGLTKLMMEARLQFDLLETGQAWERCRLVVIPDELMPDEQMIERLHRYLEQGGAVLVCGNGGLQAETGASWLQRYGLHCEGPSPFKPAYLVTDDDFVPDVPGYAYALYNGALRWTVSEPAAAVAALGEPLFQRSAEHYTSHFQSPFDHLSGHAAAAVSGNIGLAGFPLGGSYYSKGYWIYRSVFFRLLQDVLPHRLIETNAPLSTELTVTFQPADRASGRPERYLVHIMNWSPGRKTPSHPEMHDDPIALTEIRIRLNLPLKPVRVYSAVTDTPLQAEPVDGGIEVTIPRIQIHEAVCFELPEEQGEAR